MSPSQLIALLPEVIGATLAFAIASAAVGFCIACAGRSTGGAPHGGSHGHGSGHH